MQLSLIFIVFYQLIIQQTNQSSFCPLHFFRCDTQRCLPDALICNGEYNCHDKTDEVNCSLALINNHRCQSTSSISCEQDILRSTFHMDHQIHHGDIHSIPMCIKRSSVCDGVMDCRNGIDEDCARQNPLITCSTNEYHCQITHRCIPNSWKCNGRNDCLDPFASDELDCSRKKINCSSDEFRCQSNDQCIPSMAVCDGIIDCADESDELSNQCSRFIENSSRICPHDQFQCQSSKLCIPTSNQCDTITHCHDRSDEMSCTCPANDYLREQLFYRDASTNRCFPKDMECDLTSSSDDDDQSCPLFIYRPCSVNDTCLGENEYCREYFPRKYCVCQHGYRMNETTGNCEDINECRERVVCDHYCINIVGSYRCACQENYHLKSDQHTCTRRSANSSILYGLLDREIQRWMMNESATYPLDNYAYLIDHDPVANDLYFAECAVPLRPMLMSCSKTTGIFRIHLNQSKPSRELIVDGQIYRSIESMAVDWLHRNIYFVNTRSQTIDVCRLNGSFCRILLHQTISDYLPRRILLYPEKGFLFYTAVVKSRAQHIIRLGMDGTNFKLLFTSPIMHDVENVNYLRPLLTMDRINHYLYFYNGLDKIHVLNMHGDILHIQYQTEHPFHAFTVFADKIYKAFLNQSDFRIHSKYALGTTSYNELSSSLSKMIDFIIVDPDDMTREYPIVDDQCEHLSFPNAINQSEIICRCGEYYTLDNDGYSCLAQCPEHFFYCHLSEKCLPLYQRCDGIMDCIFGEDEHPLICEHFDNRLKNDSNFCSDVEFFCDGKCVSISHRCNGKPYCYDGADEPDDCLNVTCPNDYFKCPASGKCISNEKLCDHFEDCPDVDRINGITADETTDRCNLNATLNTTTTIPIHTTCESANLFRCKTSHVCINRTYVCDGDLDCLDSSDEENCDSISLPLRTDDTCIHGYRCIQGSVCLPLNELCDGVAQCPLGDDEHPWRCRNCSDCHSTSSYCELINRQPICQCRQGYAKLANGSCIYEDNLCHWSYGICSQVKLSSVNEEGDFCARKNTYVNCQCDYGYEMIKNVDNSISCVVKTNQTFEVMLNPRATFYLSLHGSIFAPIHASHHVIDAVFIPWYIFYIEQRNGHAFIWKQYFNGTHQLPNNATQIWSSSLFQFSLLKVDWIHRLIYAFYHDPSASTNGIEILHANEDYTNLTFVNRMTFSNRKTISSIQVHPLQGYLYISAYYDAQHSFVYRSLLDGSNLRIFLTLDYPTLSMALDYRHPRLYVLLSNGEIESYSIDASQPWKKSVYHFQSVRPYAMELHDDMLSVMVFNATTSIYDEIEVEKFGRSIVEKHRQLETPMLVRYIHEFTYPTADQSNSKHLLLVCSAGFCPADRICITTPLDRPLCIIPGQMNLCGLSCQRRGICSNGECVCSNQTYVGEDCEMCRLTDSVHAGCFHSSCTCYLTRSPSRQTPYLCTTLKHDRGEIEVPCDRIISPMQRPDCSRAIFLNPTCDSSIYSLIFDVPTQSCICRETMNRRDICLNNGLLILNDSSSCQCPHGFTGRQCEDICVLEQNQPVCRRKALQSHTWIILSIVVCLLSIGGYIFLRYNLKWIRVKHLFAHRRLHEHIGLEGYSHLLTNDVHCHDRPLEDVLSDENQLVEESIDDPFYVDEKRPIFSHCNQLMTSARV